MTITGTVRETLAGRDAGSLVTTASPGIDVDFEGVIGDRHRGYTRAADARVPHYPRGTPIRNTRQLSLVSVEELAAIATAMNLPAVTGTWLGANLVIAGVPHLTRVPAGSRLHFPSGASLAVEGENLPCTGPGRVIAAQFPDRDGLATQFPKAALHLRGLVAWVERPGAIRAGDQFEVRLAEPQPYPGH